MKLAEEIPGYDPSYFKTYEGSWCDFEENGWIYIFTKDSKFYVLEYQYRVEAEDHSQPVWHNDFREVSDDEALELITEWDEMT